MALAVNDKGVLLADPEVELIGIPEKNADGESMDDLAYNAVVETIDSLPKPRRRDPDSIEEAVRRVGLEPRRTAIRGGTDGSALTEMGLPTPNIFTGGHDAHSEREWICVEDMGLAAATVVELAQIWAE